MEAVTSSAWNNFKNKITGDVCLVVGRFAGSQRLHGSAPRPSLILSS